MKKIIIAIFTILFVLLTLVISVFFIFFKQAPITYAQYNSKKINKQIDDQLLGVNRNDIRKKASLINEKSIAELQKSVEKGVLTYYDITAYYLDRIQRIDQKEQGINAILVINPDAIKLAKKYDTRKNVSKKALYGLPVTIKDNINTFDMPTSSGTYALRNFIPKSDATVVSKLKEQEAIILAKTNLSELANFMSYKMPDGYSSSGGQTQNPFGKLKLSPLGSSSGSAASVTSNIGVASLGSETTGSIISPSYAQSVVGFKPSHNNVSNSGVFPLSPSLDTVGPIAKNVQDVIQIYNSISYNNRKKINLDTLRANELKGKRIGISSSLNDKDKNVIKNLIHNLGGETLHIEFDESSINSNKIISNEFKFALAAFSEKNHLPFKNLEQLIEYNKQDKHKRMKYGQILIEQANKIDNKDENFVSSQISLAQRRLSYFQRKKHIDFIVSYNDRDVLLPSVAGYPVVTLPNGKDENNQLKALTLIGFENRDEDLLRGAYTLEKNLIKRETPEL
ncbi:amidase family protein [Staphylococcus agnetis]|uniref:amidase family protein n=2 Tax=Staphylococcus agnetis TaxID=985762 RepID=UPI00208F41A7|nr:amidase family protein [Staphylococcus agnetis]MCO4342142.1 amidase family protein [Staphylococcus agnetis]MCO4344247.1 amidase family protein [Staphylococcus agnetis]MCO4368123.1 amidase family protein [Staphylococcus agnetis]